MKRNAEETRARMLAAASAEFAACGYAGARLAHVAKRTGVQQALVHHYFDGKRDLYRAVIEEALGRVQLEGLQLLARPIEMTAEAVREIVGAFVELLLRFNVEHRELFALFRHEAEADALGRSARNKRGTGEEAGLALRIVETRIRPLFEDAVKRIESWRRRGLVGADVDARHFCLALLGMTSLVARDGALVHALVPDVEEASLMTGQRDEITRVALARLGLDRRKRATPASRSHRA